jgi:hypothetical protein
LAARPRTRCIAPPVRARDDVDAVLHELLTVAWKNDVRLSVRLEQALEEQDVGAACRRRITEAGTDFLQLFADGHSYRGLQPGREAWNFPVSIVNQMTDEHDDRGNPQPRVDARAVGVQAPENQTRVTPCGREIAEALASDNGCFPVPVFRFAPISKDQRGFSQCREHPVAVGGWIGRLVDGNTGPGL